MQPTTMPAFITSNNGQQYYTANHLNSSFSSSCIIPIHHSSSNIIYAPTTASIEGHYIEGTSFMKNQFNSSLGIYYKMS